MLGFERINHLIAVAAVAKQGFSSFLSLKDVKIEVGFTDYVKSQVHLNVSDDLYGRPLHDYADSLRYLRNGLEKYYPAAKKTLRYFYSDMADFLINNAYNVELNLVVDNTLGLPVRKFSLSDVSNRLRFIADSVSADDVREFEYAEILDFVNDREDLLTKLGSYSMAAILKKASESTELYCVVVEDRL